MFFDGFFDVDWDMWYLMLVVVDEVQLFVLVVVGEVIEEVCCWLFGVMIDLMCWGCKCGFVGIIVIQWFVKFVKNVVVEVLNFLMGWIFLDIDMVCVVDFLGMEWCQVESFWNLDWGYFIFFGLVIFWCLILVKIGLVEMVGWGGGFKFMLLLEQFKEEVKDLIFIFVLGEVWMLCLCVMELMVLIGEVLDQLINVEQVVEVNIVFVESLFEYGVCEEKIVEIIFEILVEEEVVFQLIVMFYQDFQVWCWIVKLFGGMFDLQVFCEKFFVVWVGVDKGEVDDSVWVQVELIVVELLDDMCGVYLFLVKVVFVKVFCFGNLEIVMVYGICLLGCVCWLFSYMEECGFLVCVMDLCGNWIVILFDFGW